jgi:hypothetical protein
MSIIHQTSHDFLTNDLYISTAQTLTYPIIEDRLHTNFVDSLDHQDHTSLL